MMKIKYKVEYYENGNKKSKLIEAKTDAKLQDIASILKINVSDIIGYFKA